jgi:hypothetical protein
MTWDLPASIFSGAAELIKRQPAAEPNCTDLEARQRKLNALSQKHRLNVWTCEGIIVFAMAYAVGRSAVFEQFRKRLFGIASRMLETSARSGMDAMKKE